jgi:hypothetical protein
MASLAIASARRSTHRETPFLLLSFLVERRYRKPENTTTRRDGIPSLSRLRRPLDE